MRHRTQRPTLRALAPAVACAAVLAGCALPANLRPAPGADDATWLDQAAVSEVDGVEVVAQANAWPGDPQVPTEVTPIRVVIENDGVEPVRVRYQEFALVADDGRSYAALPPYGVEGQVTDRVVVHNADPVFDPRFVHRDFFVVDTIGPTWYPDFDTYDGPFDRDVYYYEHYHEYWVDIDMPTPSMLAHVIPEGVVSPGGKVDGFLFFEKVDDDHSRVRFRADMVAAATGDVLGEVSIPFVVD